MGCLSLIHIENQSPLSVAHRKNEVFSNSSTVSYRYGFNGMEKDDEHTQGKYDFGARIYDARLGRMLSIDPKVNQFPGLSCYLFAASNPVWFVDENGENYKITVDRSEASKKEGKSLIKIATTVYIGQEDYDKFSVIMGQPAGSAVKSELSKGNSFRIMNPNTTKSENKGATPANYEVKIGDETFIVEFEVNIVVVADRATAKQKAREDRNGNSLEYLDNPNKKANYSKLNNDRGMGGRLRARGKLASSFGLTFTHELAHAFGLDHFWSKDETDGVWNITSYRVIGRPWWHKYWYGVQ